MASRRSAEWLRDLDYVIDLLKCDRGRASGNAKVFGSLLTIPLVAIVSDFITLGGPFRLLTSPWVLLLLMMVLITTLPLTVSSLFQSYDADWLIRQLLDQLLRPASERPALQRMLVLRDVLLRTPIASIIPRRSMRIRTEDYPYLDQKEAKRYRGIRPFRVPSPGPGYIYVFSVFGAVALFVLIVLLFPFGYLLFSPLLPLYFAPVVAYTGLDVFAIWRYVLARRRFALKILRLNQQTTSR